MTGLTEAIRRCKVKLKLDNFTEGYGNCFPNAIVQQCRRPEVKKWLLQNKPHAMFRSQQALRREVKNFALTSQNVKVNNYRINYNETLSGLDKSWLEYWNEMQKDGTWVDSAFIQLTAWYIGLDIKILTTSSSSSEHPFIIMSGNIDNIPEEEMGPPLLIGNYTNVHYQSLLPTTSIKAVSYTHLTLPTILLV